MVNPLVHVVLQPVPGLLFAVGAAFAGRLYDESRAPAHLWLPLHRSRSRVVVDQARDLHRPGMVDRLASLARHEHDLRTLVAQEFATPLASIRAYAHVLGADVEAFQEIDTPVLVRTPADHDLAGDVRHVGRILVPTSGTGAGRRATELAAAIARHHGAHVVVLHVVTTRERVMAGVAELVDMPLPNSVAEELVDLEATVLGEFGVTSVTTVIEQHRHVDHAILDVASRERVELVILSASRRSMSERAFLGHHTESVLRSATCTVAVVS